jgi:hypothetical protein
VGCYNPNTATFICVHRQQHWDGGWSYVITPGIENGMLLALANRLQELVTEIYNNGTVLTRNIQVITLTSDRA